MPIYDVQCESCGPGEVVKSMAEVNGEWVCPKCNGPASRLFTPPYDHSENTFHPYYSDALSDTAGQAYVSSRANEKERMLKMGVERYEKGTVRENQKAWKEYRENITRETTQRVRESTVRKLYFAKNYGYAPTRGE